MKLKTKQKESNLIFINIHNNIHTYGYVENLNQQNIELDNKLKLTTKKK